MLLLISFLGRLNEEKRLLTVEEVQHGVMLRFDSGDLRGTDQEGFITDQSCSADIP